MKSDENELLRSVALQNATSILAARRRAERRSEAYLTEAQRLSHTGSFGWTISTGEIFWSEETFRVFQYDRTTTPTLELILQRVHPEDAASVRQTIERASKDGKDFEHEYRLVIPEGAIKHVNVVAHALSDKSDGIEFVGAVMDITDSKACTLKHCDRAEPHLAEAQRLTHTGSWVWQVARRDAVHLSEEWYRIYGFDPEQGVPVWEQRLRRVQFIRKDRAEWHGGNRSSNWRKVGLRSGSATPSSGWHSQIHPHCRPSCFRHIRGFERNSWAALRISLSEKGPRCYWPARNDFSR